MTHKNYYIFYLNVHFNIIFIKNIHFDFFLIIITLYQYLFSESHSI